MSANHPSPATPLPRYVVFGEALTDMIFKENRTWLGVPGGSCWNVARVAARLGVPTGFAGAVSLDLFGDDLEREGTRAGLDRRFLQRVHAAPLLAIVPSSDPPRYFFIGERSADLHFDPGSLPSSWREAAEIVHFGGISLAREPLATRLAQEASSAVAAGKRVAFDPNFRTPMQSAGYDAIFRSVAGLASYLKVSEEDLFALFPGRTESNALLELRQIAPDAQVLLTRGASGMTLLYGSQRLDEPAFPVDVVDTVGCGDAAMGAWISSLLLHPEASAADHVRVALAAAARAAAHAGPYSPSSEEVKQELVRQGHADAPHVLKSA